MAESKFRELMRSLKSRYPTASEEELADRFAEELRNDEVLNKAILEEVFQLMSNGLERVWPKT
jgi:hypothetical protein